MIRRREDPIRLHPAQHRRAALPGMLGEDVKTRGHKRAVLTFFKWCGVVAAALVSILWCASLFYDLYYSTWINLDSSGLVTWVGVSEGCLRWVHNSDTTGVDQIGHWQHWGVQRRSVSQMWTPRFELGGRLWRRITLPMW